jgi:hypothetical protein
VAPTLNDPYTVGSTGRYARDVPSTSCDLLAGLHGKRQQIVGFKAGCQDGCHLPSVTQQTGLSVNLGMALLGVDDLGPGKLL